MRACLAGETPRPSVAAAAMAESAMGDGWWNARGSRAVHAVRVASAAAMRTEGLRAAGGECTTVARWRRLRRGRDPAATVGGNRGGGYVGGYNRGYGGVYYGGYYRGGGYHGGYEVPRLRLRIGYYTWEVIGAWAYYGLGWGYYGYGYGYPYYSYGYPYDYPYDHRLCRRVSPAYDSQPNVTVVYPR